MSIYTHKAKTWKATNTQAKIDSFFSQEWRKRFWARVNKRADGGCWEWTGPTGAFGYGNTSANCMTFRANRVAYMIAKGPIPADLHILHSCHNRLCVNPDHLSAGTVQQNAKDREMYGKNSLGEGNGQSKLTEQDVIAIRLSKDRPSVLAKRYGVHPSTIYCARTGRKWGSLKTGLPTNT